jgi:D-aminoacyl-tRNA deacylase
MKLIVTSEQDTAGSNMYELLFKEFGFQEDGEFEGNKKYKKNDFVLIKIKKKIIDIEHLPEFFKPEIYICASKHKAEKRIKSLTVHTPGNWGKADYFGQPKSICTNPALFVKKALLSLKENKQKNSELNGFEVTLEVTHHGPSIMNAPVMFVEVGSCEEDWKNIDACRCVCNAILSLDSAETADVYVGFGGPHYAPNFTKIIFESNVAISHIIPKHYVDEVDEKLIIESFDKTFPKTNKALLDWKGLTGEQRQKLIRIFEKNNIEYKKIKDIK